MTFTILSSIFLAFLLLLALIGFKVVMGQNTSPKGMNREICSLCQERYDKPLLIERQIGDHRLMFFCPSCINKLHDDLASKN